VLAKLVYSTDTLTIILEILNQLLEQVIHVNMLTIQNMIKMLNLR